MPRSAVVLAGGWTIFPAKLRALLPFRGQPVVRWTARAMAGFADDVVVSTSHGCADVLEGVLPRRVRVVEDEFIGLGPLGGLHAGAKAARYDEVAVAPCESPLSSPAFYRLLSRECRNYEGAVPFLKGEAAPYHAVYRKSPLVRALEGAIVNGECGVGAAVAGLRIRRVGAARIGAVGGGKMSLLEFWTPEALRAAGEDPSLRCCPGSAAGRARPCPRRD